MNEHFTERVDEKNNPTRSLDPKTDPDVIRFFAELKPSDHFFIVVANEKTDADGEKGLDISQMVGGNPRAIIQSIKNLTGRSRLARKIIEISAQRCPLDDLLAGDREDLRGGDTTADRLGRVFGRPGSGSGLANLLGMLTVLEALERTAPKQPTTTTDKPQSDDKS